ncbi:MAG: hypothetical protein Hyperionvirus10_4 [Hyperionvirus sp.]|uniref:Sel1 repeat family protein n=1 Tax=Hyperionvirus sp. TaxID=2487770 RepID=A0A3G5A8U3_9VIRU|nr:MAG: hypothetical protein Hyperionvirus10_4 [Hyperionvirus sp.]
MGNNLVAAFQACIDRYNAKDYSEALTQFKVLAEQSHAESIYMVGVMYYNGQGCDKNLEEAYKQFLKAHRLTEIKATFRVGMCLRKGEGVSKDEKEAIKYLKQAHSKGHIEATYLLGLLAFFGESSTEKDYGRAKVYFEEAYSKNHIDATYQLGFIHQNGFGTEKDSKKAFEYYEESYKKGYIRSALHLGEILLSSEDPNDHILGVKYLTHARTSGDTDAIELLGNFYLKGSIGVPSDSKEALKCFLEAYQKGSGHLSSQIGDHYANLTGAVIDSVQAKQFYEQALTEYNNLTAARKLFELYLFESDEKNIPIMQRYLTIMENSNDPDLLWYAGHASHFRLSIHIPSFPIDKKKGFQCYLKSAELGNFDSMEQIWGMYFVGSSCEKNYEKALYWFSKAYCPEDNRDSYYITLASYFSGVPPLIEKLYSLYAEEYRSKKIKEETLSKLLYTIPHKFFIEKSLSELKV